VDIQKTEAESATIRNQESVPEGEEERIQSEGVEKAGAGEWNRTTDLRFTNQWNGIAQVVDGPGSPRLCGLETSPINFSAVCLSSDVGMPICHSR
jgi:hypothetical protein